MPSGTPGGGNGATVSGHRHAHGEPCANCRTDPCPLCSGTGKAGDPLGELLAELPEVDVSDLLDPLGGMPLRERLRARARALVGDLDQLHGPEADDLAARLRGFLERLDATTPGSTKDPTTRRRRAKR